MSQQASVEVTGAPSGEASPEPSERRLNQRVSVDLFVQERDGDRFFVHPATNISEGGVFILSHSFSLRKTIERRHVDLEIELPSRAEPVKVRGTVVWSRRMRDFSHGLGVRFENLAPEDRTAIASYLEERAAEVDTSTATEDLAPLGTAGEPAPTRSRIEREDPAAGFVRGRPSGSADDEAP